MRSSLNGTSHIFPKRQKHLALSPFSHVRVDSCVQKDPKFGRRGDGLIKKHELMGLSLCGNSNKVFWAAEFDDCLVGPMCKMYKMTSGPHEDCSLTPKEMPELVSFDCMVKLTNGVSLKDSSLV